MSKATDFKSRVRTADLLLRLPREELAGHLLLALQVGPYELLGRYALIKQIAVLYDADEGSIRIALATAWTWLVVQGLIVKDPSHAQGDFYVITPKGAALADESALKTYYDAARFPRHLLEPVIAEKVWLSFTTGDYDAAVFQAFKQVEICVREAAGLTSDDIGTDLMRRAFGIGGPLDNPLLPKSERENLAHLFAGTIGVYKNPHSHRSVSIDAVEAMEMLVLATHLIRIARARGIVRMVRQREPIGEPRDDGR
jgi:uncharacterized protein (TIGR02391 family)